MGINNNYSNYVNSYANAATQKTRQNSQIGKIEATQEDYIKKLQEKNPQIDITIGKPANSEPKRSVRRSRTAAMRSRAAIL